MRHTLLTILMALSYMSLFAIPARHGVRTIEQPDGTSLEIRLVGDEYFHCYMTEDGIPVAENDKGEFVYRTPEGLTDMMAHNAELRSQAEKRFIKRNDADLSFESIRNAAPQQIKRGELTNIGRVQHLTSQVPQTGSAKVPVILIQYTDIKFKDSDPKETFENFFNGPNKSTRQYFIEQSNGAYTPQFDIYGPFTTSSNRATYGGNDRYGYDKGLGKMVAEGCIGLDSEIDFSKYDNDGDGECDVLIVLYAGVGEASSYISNSIWPCQWDLNSSDYGKNLILDGTTISKFAVFNELNGDASAIDGIGTVCHEFSHCLDLPDFYDTNYGNHFGMGPWSLMDYGSYNDDGHTPIGYSAYEKAFMGWITIPESEEDMYFSLPPMNLGSAQTDLAVKLTNPADKNEYYILENRAQQGWDQYIPAPGLMITHVTYNANSWYNNTVNDYDLQRMTIIPSDNNLTMIRQYNEYFFDPDATVGDLWPYAGNDELTDTSLPAAKVNTGEFLSKPVTEITRHNDGNVSFWVMKQPSSFIDAPDAEYLGQGSVRYYNLQGQRMESPVRGITILVDGSGARKILR